MVVLEKWVLVGVDGEHGVALLHLAGGVASAVLQVGDTQRRAIGPGEPGSHRSARPPIGFEDGVCRDDAVLPTAPRVAEGEGLGRRLATGIETSTACPLCLGRRPWS